MPVTIPDLIARKQRHERFAMLTAYDALTARIFDEAGIPALLVGDSAAMVVLGHPTTLQIGIEEMEMLTAAVARGARNAVVLADLPFGSYQADAAEAVRNAVRLLKAGAHAVKLEGAPLATVERIVAGGIPVCGHLGLQPQSYHALGGFRVQGRGHAGERLLADAIALERSGCFAIVLETVPAALAGEVTKAVAVPTIGIGAGLDVDAQVLVGADLIGLTTGLSPRFVKRYGDVASNMSEAARAFASDVEARRYPAPEHAYD